MAEPEDMNAGRYLRLPHPCSERDLVHFYYKSEVGVICQLDQHTHCLRWSRSRNNQLQVMTSGDNHNIGVSGKRNKEGH